MCDRGFGTNFLL